MWAAAPGHLRRIQWSTRHDRKYLMWTEKYFMLTKKYCAISAICYLQQSEIFTGWAELLWPREVFWLWSERKHCSLVTSVEPERNTLWRFTDDDLTSCGRVQLVRPAACGATSYWRETAEIIIRSYSFSLVGQSRGKLSWPLQSLIKARNPIRTNFQTNDKYDVIRDMKLLD